MGWLNRRVNDNVNMGSVVQNVIIMVVVKTTAIIFIIVC